MAEVQPGAAHETFAGRFYANKRQLVHQRRGDLRRFSIYLTVVDIQSDRHLRGSSLVEEVVELHCMRLVYYPNHEY